MKQSAETVGWMGKKLVNAVSLVMEVCWKSGIVLEDGSFVYKTGQLNPVEIDLCNWISDALNS